MAEAFAKEWRRGLDAIARREQKTPDRGQAISPPTLKQGQSSKNAFDMPMYFDGIEKQRQEMVKQRQEIVKQRQETEKRRQERLSRWAPDVDGGMKTDAAVKRGNGTGKLPWSIDSYDDLDTQSEFGLLKEAERIEKTRVPLNPESSARFPMRRGEKMLPHRPARMSNEYKSRDDRDDVPYFARYPVDEEYPVDEGSAGTFACPFYKRDPEMFGHGKWKYCAHASWKGYHGVREHIYRKHSLPTNYCDICFEDLKDAQSLLQHRSQVQCEKKSSPYTAAERLSQLKLLRKRGITESETWRNMYCILFPGDTHIPSPWLLDEEHVSRKQTSQQLPYKPYSTSAPSPTLPIVSSQPSQHQPSSDTWSQQDDQQLLQARMQGLNWNQIKEQYFPLKTPNTCRKRHERLIERRGPNDWDARKMQIRAKKEAYISLLADDLLTKALIEKLDEESLDRICRALPRHLKTFAMKIGSSDPAPICREVMVFVRKYRNEIANSARENYITENGIRSDVLGNRTAGMDVSDLINKWDLDLNLSQDPNTILNKKPDDVMDDTHYDHLDEIDPVTDSLPELSVYKDFISKHPAYELLLQSIQKELYMDSPGDIQIKIRDTILGHLAGGENIYRREAPKRHILTFTADWDPRTFSREQEYRESPQEAVERAITIVGSKVDAQAATTMQYLKQIWPSSGSHLLQVIKHVVCNDDSLPFSYSLPDNTQLIARSRGSNFRLEVTGTADVIADIGEQLAWLGSALRSSPLETGVTIVGAVVSGVGANPSEVAERQAPTYFCNIGFHVDVIDGTGEISNGQCWHQLFRNPVIVKGYPIPRRPISNIGLEISLDTLARLAGTGHISTFNNKLFIKGFSTMLIPTRYSDSILLWHLICKKNGDHVSYLDEESINAADVGLSDLFSSRHFLGWSSQVRYLVGSADANYNIHRSWLRDLHENCKFGGISITKDHPIQSNHRAAIGKRETPLWIVHKPYRKRLGLLSQKYMVLWDVGCKRGWLVNGVNALLHLFRASIEIDQTSELSSDSQFRSELFEEASKPYTVSAAKEVLMNSANLDMELYEEYERDESGVKIKYRVRDRLNELYEALEKAIDYQQMIGGNRGEGLKSAPRKDLEGWDFKDIAASEDRIYPRLAKLKTIGKGWVDFARAIGAVFLFGNDFGNLIVPATEKSTCSYWQVLPADKCYLAASVEDLNSIMDRMGNPRANPPRLTNSLVWHPFNMMLNTECDCSTLKKTYCERTQAIWPLHISRQSPKSISSQEVNGAVVFGHNASMGLIWNDFGDPEKGELPLLDEESDDDNSADSGIGLSLHSSTIPESQHLGQNIYHCGHEKYKIAIICALPEELMAVRALFDETHQDLPQHESDANTYALGRLGTHFVVAACLPSGDYGTNAASRVASDIEKSFSAVKWYFVVGIGGGIPSEEHDIRLGDVVVSTGVIQHDMGKVTQKDSKIKSTGLTQRPARSLLTAISSVQSDPSLTHNALEAHIQHIVGVRPEYQSPGEDCDKLFPANSKHISKQKTCENCKGPHVLKKSRPPGPHIHYGLIASGNQVIKDAVTRDRIGAEMNVLCFEMEGAGVMATGNCLVIRGICDYADSHKNDKWHKYAAATAAAYTKLFLLRIPNLDVQNRETVQMGKRSASSMEDDGIYPSQRARYL